MKRAIIIATLATLLAVAIVMWLGEEPCPHGEPRVGQDPAECIATNGPEVQPLGPFLL